LPQTAMMTDGHDIQTQQLVKPSVFVQAG